MGYPATPKTWISGDVLTAAQLNAELRDALLGAFPLGPPDTAWTAYTPTLTQSATVTKTVTWARYRRVGRTVDVEVFLTVTGAGTAANAVLIGLPVAAAAPTFSIVGLGSIYTGSNYKGVAVLASTTTVQLDSIHATTDGPLGVLSFTGGLAAGNLVKLNATYEAAT